MSENSNLLPRLSPGSNLLLARHGSNLLPASLRKPIEAPRYHWKQIEAMVVYYIKNCTEVKYCMYLYCMLTSLEPMWLTESIHCHERYHLCSRRSSLVPWLESMWFGSSDKKRDQHRRLHSQLWGRAICWYMLSAQVWEDLQTTEIDDALIDTTIPKGCVSIEMFLFSFSVMKSYGTEKQFKGLTKKPKRQQASGFLAQLKDTKVRADV
jgi:hypothetical protein